MKISEVKTAKLLVQIKKQISFTFQNKKSLSKQKNRGVGSFKCIEILCFIASIGILCGSYTWYSQEFINTNIQMDRFSNMIGQIKMEASDMLYTFNLIVVEIYNQSQSKDQQIQKTLNQIKQNKRLEYFKQALNQNQFLSSLEVPICDFIYCTKTQSQDGRTYMQVLADALRNVQIFYGEVKKFKKGTSLTISGNIYLNAYKDVNLIKKGVMLIIASLIKQKLGKQYTLLEWQISISIYWISLCIFLCLWLHFGMKNQCKTIYRECLSFLTIEQLKNSGEFDYEMSKLNNLTSYDISVTIDY